MRRLPRLAALAAALSALSAPGALAAPTWLPAQSTGTGMAIPGLRDDGSSALVSVITVSGQPLQSAIRGPRGNWTLSTELDTDPSFQSPGPLVVTAPNGTITAIWMRNGAGFSRDLFASSQRAGQPWTTPVQISAPGDGVSDPLLTVAPDNTVTAAWINASGRVRTATTSPAGVWGTPEQPLESAFTMSMALATDRAGTTTLVAHINQIAESVVSIDRPSGGSWSAPSTIKPGDASQLALAIAPDGRRYAAWATGSPNVLSIATRAAGAASWSSAAPGPTPVDGTVHRLLGPVEGSGALTLLWADGTTGNVTTTLRAATRTAGAWSAVTRLSPVGAYDSSLPTLLSGTESGALMAAPLGQNAGIAARLANGTWESPTTLTPSVPTGLAVLPDGDAMIGLAEVTSNAPPVVIGSSRILDAAGPRVGGLQTAPVTAGQPAALSSTIEDRFSDIASVTWDFGDGTSATTPGGTTTHTWTKPGDTTVRITATDTVGNATTTQTTLNVAAAPTPVPTPSPTAAATPTPTPAPTPVPAFELKLLADGFGKQLLLGKRRIPVVLSCGRYDCTVRLRASLLIGKRTLGRLPTVRGSIPAREKRTFFLETTVAQRRAMRRAVRKGRDAVVRVRVTATTSAGTKQAEQRISLRDLS